MHSRRAYLPVEPDHLALEERLAVAVRRRVSAHDVEGVEVLGEVVNKLKIIENRTPATDDFIRHLEMFPGKVREMQTKLSDAYKNAVVQNALESAKGKLVTAAHEGGMATGTSGELPAGMLDKLGKFLAEDPFGAAEKIDKFCTYLENNGPAALHVADGKDVDLDRLFREVVG